MKQRIIYWHWLGSNNLRWKHIPDWPLPGLQTILPAVCTEFLIVKFKEFRTFQSFLTDNDLDNLLGSYFSASTFFYNLVLYTLTAIWRFEAYTLYSLWAGMKRPLYILFELANTRYWTSIIASFHLDGPVAFITIFCHCSETAKGTVEASCTTKYWFYYWLGLHG